MSTQKHLKHIALVTATWIYVKSSSSTPVPDNGPGYGTEWLYYLDERANQLVMNFSTIPADTKTMFFGDAYFHLYTRRNKNESELLVIPDDNSTLKSNFFDARNQIKFITHGWLSSDRTEWVQNIKNAYLEYYDYNVITVDWSEISENKIYPWPALSTRYVGKRIAQLISSMGQTYDVKGSDIHLIGHSLGAQVMGNAGMFSKLRISRITGLDPARPLFELPQMPTNFRLDRSDAEFVDIIHTCVGVYGYLRSHGHGDFYPNNGRNQPGCDDDLGVCDHGMACTFFEESIHSNTSFVAYPCETWKDYEDGKCRDNSTDMGDNVSQVCSGDYYLRTNSRSPYARGRED